MSSVGASSTAKVATVPVSGLGRHEAGARAGRTCPRIGVGGSHRRSNVPREVAPGQTEDEMLITTANDLPGHDIERVLGEVFGLTVRSRNLGSQIGSSLKSLLGGELQGMTTMLAQGREQAIERLVQEATIRGGNAIVAMRFDTSELGSTWTEICAYGTAVVARGL